MTLAVAGRIPTTFDPTLDALGRIRIGLVEFGLLPGPVDVSYIGSIPQPRIAVPGDLPPVRACRAEIALELLQRDLGDALDARREIRADPEIGESEIIVRLDLFRATSLYPFVQ